jgi:hypothetical protein
MGLGVESQMADEVALAALGGVGELSTSYLCRRVR